MLFLITAYFPDLKTDTLLKESFFYHVMNLKTSKNILLDVISGAFFTQISQLVSSGNDGFFPILSEIHHKTAILAFFFWPI